MNLVFMNSLEKETEPGRFRTAVVSIVEEKGLHQIHWREPDDSGRHRQELWYEGDNWEEMLATFQYRITSKMAEGYMPVIERMPPRPDRLSPSARLVQMQVFYSERHADEALFQRLRAWRRERAAKEGKAPFIIANNRLLRLIAAFVPHSPEELLQLPGFGQNKLELYGDEILALTRKVKQERPFPPVWVAEAVDHDEFLEWLYAQKEMKFKAEAEQLNRKKRLLESIRAGESLEQMESELGIPARDIVLQIERLEAEGVDLAEWVGKELAGVSNSEREQVLRAFGKLGDKYLKPVLETVYTVPGQQEETERMYIRLRLLRLLYRQQTGKQQEHRAG